MPDGRLLLQVKDAPFEKPVMARFASDGTLKILAYLTLLHDPDPPRLIGIEEPENQLHPRLLPELAEECRKAAGCIAIDGNDSLALLRQFFAPGGNVGALPRGGWLYPFAEGLGNARHQGAYG